MKSLKRQFKILKSIKPDEIKREEFSQLIAEMSAGCRAPSFSWCHSVVFFRSVSALALISALFLAASGAGITFASQNALPGEVLYPAKLAIEKIRITAAKDTEKKTELRLEFASRRLDEVEKIVEQKNETGEKEVAAALEDYEKKLDDTEKVSPSDARESAKVYEKNIVELISRAEEKKFDGKVKERLKRAHERTKEKFKDSDKDENKDAKEDKEKIEEKVEEKSDAREKESKEKDSAKEKRGDRRNPEGDDDDD